MQKEDDSKERLWREAADLGRSQFDLVWDAAFKAGVEQGRETALAGLREFLASGGVGGAVSLTPPATPAPPPRIPLRVLPKPHQKSLGLNRAPSGAVQEI